MSRDRPREAAVAGEGAVGGVSAVEGLVERRRCRYRVADKGSGGGLPELGTICMNDLMVR